MRAEVTLGELFERYIEDRERAGKRSTNALRETWERYVGELPEQRRKKHGRVRTKPVEAVDWSKCRISEITTQQISTLHVRIVRAGKAVTANRVHELLRAMYGYAKRQKLVADNPAERITPAQEKDRSRFLGRGELPLFIDALKQEVQPWRDFFTVLLYVGYRRAAVAAMRWQDIDLKAGMWTVPGERAKNGDPIVLPLMGPALTTLRRRWRERESSMWVFPGGTKAGHVSEPEKAWKRILSRASINDLRIHDLRRTLGSWLAMSGVSLPAIGRALGHKDPRAGPRKLDRAMKAVLANPKVVPLPLRRGA